MGAVPSSPSRSRRRLWHPLTVAGALTAAALGTAGAVAAGAGPAPLVPGAWLLMGAASGFATSGST
jgi:hypothetical protein